MTYHSNYCDNFLWYLLLRGNLKKEKEKTKAHPNTKFLHFFKCTEQKVFFAFVFEKVLLLKFLNYEVLSKTVCVSFSFSSLFSSKSLLFNEEAVLKFDFRTANNTMVFLLTKKAAKSYFIFSKGQIEQSVNCCLTSSSVFTSGGNSYRFK